MKKRIGNKSVTDFFVMDIETYENTEFKFGVLYSEKIKTSDNGFLFDSFYDMFQYLIYQVDLKVINVFAHYGGGFGFFYLLNYLFQNKSVKFTDINFIDSQGLLIQVDFRIEDKHFYFKDSFALFRSSLNKVSDALLGKKKIEIDIEHRDSVDINKFYTYCWNDCYLLYWSLIEYRNIIQQEFKLTIASQALDYFLKFHCNKEFPKQTNFEYRMLKPYYYGGRVEVFKRYGENLFAYDVNNMYGFVMREHGALIGKPKFVNVASKSDGIGGFYSIRLTKNYNMYIPFLSAKIGQSKYDKKLYFLNSTELNYRCTTYDLKLLDAFGMKYEIIGGIEFEHDKNFFKSYIEYWSNKIKENPKRKFIYKLMINSLFGKFGQKREFNKIVIGENLDSYINEVYNIGYKKQYQNGFDFNYINISAWVTAGARFELFKYLWKYRDNVYYCDTDSLFLDKQIDNNDFSDLEFGKLKLEKTVERGYFLTQKMYCLCNNGLVESVIKGFKRQSFTEDKFKAALYNDVFDFEETQRKMRHLRGVLRSKNGFIEYFDFKKRINQITMKRKLCADKINTIPFNYKNNQLN